MDKMQTELTNHIFENQDKMVTQLHEFCDINSGTENLNGLSQMREILQLAFEPIADCIQRKTLPLVPIINMSGKKSQQSCADALFICKRPQLKRRILLCGHMDTVYAKTHSFQKLSYINDNQLKGPGVTDMKGGLIVMLHALSALEQCDEAKQLGWDVFINSDEEIGSPASKFILEDLAHKYQAALVYEPTMTVTGTLAKNRKGSGKFTLVATGKAAHAGRDFAAGRNAICYLAEVITAINTLNGQRKECTINVGKIWGGEALNMVPDMAVAKIDVRISLKEDSSWFKNELDIILHAFKRDGFTLTIHGEFERPVKQISKESFHLFQKLQQLGSQLGLRIDWKDSGGCCDGNNLADLGLPVLDSLGVRGGHIHSENEFILIDSLAERAALSALLLHDLAKNGLEELNT